jgi:hypothetical protein
MRPMSTSLGSRTWAVTKIVLRSPWWLLRRVANVIDSPHRGGRRPPAGNYIPNSNGEGGTVISSGHPGGL